jgi:hypothetical protein
MAQPRLISKASSFGLNRLSMIMSEHSKCLIMFT